MGKWELEEEREGGIGMFIYEVLKNKKKYIVVFRIWYIFNNC